MRPAWIPRCVVLLGALALPGCWREQPTAPRVHSITGHVVLTGYTVDHAGAFAGKRVVGDADGVLIELISGSGAIARHTTLHAI